MISKIIFFTILISFSNSLSINPSFVELSDNLCENITHGTLPYEDDCSYYIYCYNQRPSVIRCPEGQIFDRIELRCMNGNPETCETFRPYDCPLVDDPLRPVFFPHPENCSKYFMCFNGTAIARQCHYGLHWSEENEWCDFAENVNCSRTTTTTPPPPTPPLPFCRDWMHCPPEGLGYLPNFNICHRYFECIMGVRHLRTCRYGLIFDVITLRCDYPENALCVVDAECNDELYEL